MQPQHKYQSVFEGGNPIFSELYVPFPTYFHCILKKQFSKIFETLSFMSSNFFEKFPKIYRKLPEIF